MKAIGKLMQLAGLIILPVAVFMELGGLHERQGVAGMLIMMVFGVALFYVGRMLEGYARR